MREWERERERLREMERLEERMREEDIRENGTPFFVTLNFPRSSFVLRDISTCTRVSHIHTHIYIYIYVYVS